MKRFLTVMAAGFLGMFLCASVVSAAEVKTEYFTLTLPAPWKQPQPPQKANGAVSATVQARLLRQALGRVPSRVRKVMTALP